MCVYVFVWPAMALVMVISNVSHIQQSLYILMQDCMNNECTPNFNQDSSSLNRNSVMRRQTNVNYAVYRRINSVRRDSLQN